jgi:hypothetical protein
MGQERTLCETSEANQNLAHRSMTQNAATPPIV